jgi:hypothetical protein
MKKGKMQTVMIQTADRNNPKQPAELLQIPHPNLAV